MIVLLREHVHTECHRKLNFGMDTGSELYMQILQGEGEGEVLSPNRNIFRNNISGHVTYQMKALGKLYSNMPIK